MEGQIPTILKGYLNKVRTSVLRALLVDKKCL
jgi:hypothetical protein